MRKFSGEKRLSSLVYRETEKTSRQEVCTTYVGRRRPLEERKVPHARHFLEWVLAAQAKLGSVVGSVLQVETRLEVTGNNDKELYELEL